MKLLILALFLIIFSVDSLFGYGGIPFDSDDSDLPVLSQPSGLVHPLPMPPKTRFVEREFFEESKPTIIHHKVRFAKPQPTLQKWDTVLMEEELPEVLPKKTRVVELLDEPLEVAPKLVRIEVSKPEEFESRFETEEFPKWEILPTKTRVAKHKQETLEADDLVPHHKIMHTRVIEKPKLEVGHKYGG